MRLAYYLALSGSMRPPSNRGDLVSATVPMARVTVLEDHSTLADWMLSQRSQYSSIERGGDPKICRCAFGSDLSNHQAEDERSKLYGKDRLGGNSLKIWQTSFRHKVATELFPKHLLHPLKGSP